MTDAQITISLKGVPAGSPVCGPCLRRTKPTKPEWCSLHDIMLDSKCAPRGADHAFDYFRCPQCLAAEQRFTPEPPTKPGWYWFQGEPFGDEEIQPTIVWVDYKADVLYCRLVSNDPSQIWWPVDRMIGLWSGPILMPGGGE